MVKVLFTLHPIWLQGEAIETVGNVYHCCPRRYNIVHSRGFDHILFGRSTHIEVRGVFLRHLIANTNMMHVGAPDTAFLVENRNTFKRKVATTINNGNNALLSADSIPCQKRGKAHTR